MPTPHLVIIIIVPVILVVVITDVIIVVVLIILVLILLVGFPSVPAHCVGNQLAPESRPEERTQKRLSAILAVLQSPLGLVGKFSQITLTHEEYAAIHCIS